MEVNEIIPGCKMLYAFTLTIMLNYDIMYLQTKREP